MRLPHLRAEPSYRKPFIEGLCWEQKNTTTSESSKAFSAPPTKRQAIHGSVESGRVEDPWLHVPARLEDSLLLSTGLCPEPPAVKPCYNPYDSQYKSLVTSHRDISPHATRTDDNLRLAIEMERSRQPGATGCLPSRRLPQQQYHVDLPRALRKASGRVLSPPQSTYGGWMGQGKDRRDPRCCISV